MSTRHERDKAVAIPPITDTDPQKRLNALLRRFKVTPYVKPSSKPVLPSASKYPCEGQASLEDELPP